MASLVALSAWVDRERPLVQHWIVEYGAVLFRGFRAAHDAAHEFEQAAKALMAPHALADRYLGTSPRDAVDETAHVFTASEFAPWKVVPPHCEMSFLPDPPRLIAFFAAAIPADLWGGETPLIDMRAVTREMSPAARAAFARGGVRYIRRYPSARSTHVADVWDPFKTKPWEAMFEYAV